MDLALVIAAMLGMVALIVGAPGRASSMYRAGLHPVVAARPRRADVHYRSI
jgi:hypothetical protein